MLGISSINNNYRGEVNAQLGHKTQLSGKLRGTGVRIVVNMPLIDHMTYQVIDKQ